MEKIKISWCDLKKVQYVPPTRELLVMDARTDGQTDILKDRQTDRPKRVTMFFVIYHTRELIVMDAGIYDIILTFPSWRRLLVSLTNIF